jgi:uncharacterized protein
MTKATKPLLLLIFVLLPLQSATFLMTGCSSAQKITSLAGKDGQKEQQLAIIDAHTHTHFTGQPERTSQIPDTLEQYLKEMRSAGIVGAVAHTRTNDEGYINLKTHGVVHCAGINATVNVARLESGLKSGKYGCIKIYLGYVHQYAFDKNYEPAYRLAEKHDVPVVFHTGDTYSNRGKLKYSDPLTIDEVAVDHPKVKFVIAHCGNPWIESAAEVAYILTSTWMVQPFWSET